jgi:uncharacterized protein YoaH (UPF0181 family)
MGKHATTAEVDQRVATIARLMSEGMGRADVIRFCAEKWGVRTRQAEVYLARAYQLMREQWAIDRQDFLGELMSRYETVYRKAMKEKQLSVAVAALNSMGKLARVTD